MRDPTNRFSDRAGLYARYRPGYPQEVLDLLRDECGLSEASIIADVGSGTGILSKMFLENGNTVYGVEPNRKMREAAEGLLANRPGFVSVDATAEKTTLPPASVDFVCAGQAFHWFDRAQAREEFGRILRPGGWVVLVWNLPDASEPLVADYRKVTETFGRDYQTERAGNVANDEVIGRFFAPESFEKRTFANEQTFDYAGLEGRLLSASYTPLRGEPGFQEMLEELRRVFARHQRAGSVRLVYRTHLYYGRLAPSRPEDARS